MAKTSCNQLLLIDWFCYAYAHQEAAFSINGAHTCYATVCTSKQGKWFTHTFFRKWVFCAPLGRDWT